MLKKSASFVLDSSKSSTYPRGYASPSLSFLSLLSFSLSLLPSFLLSPLLALVPSSPLRPAFPCPGAIFSVCSRPLMCVVPAGPVTVCLTGRCRLVTRLRGRRGGVLARRWAPLSVPWRPPACRCCRLPAVRVFARVSGVWPSARARSARSGAASRSRPGGEARALSAV